MQIQSCYVNTGNIYISYLVCISTLVIWYCYEYINLIKLRLIFMQALDTVLLCIDAFLMACHEASLQPFPLQSLTLQTHPLLSGNLA